MGYVIRRTFALVLLIALEACVSAKPPPRPMDYPYSAIFLASYDDVWSAAVSVVESYTIVEASRESGVLKTDWANAFYNPALYKDPEKADRLEQVRFRVTMKLSKAVSSNTGETAVRVQVNKQLELYGNLVTGYQQVPTDGFEEQVILYRIQQRLRIKQAIQRERAKASQAM